MRQMGYLSLIFSAVITFLFTLWIKRKQSYFKDRGIPYAKENPILGGFSDMIMGKCGTYDNVLKICNKAEVKDKPFFGFFILQKPALMITEPKLIKRILATDFKDFANRYSSSDTHDLLGFFNLFGVKNPLWKRLRNKLTPFFSSGKLKNMFYIINEITEDLLNHIRMSVKNDVELELKELATVYSTDVIASCAFGVDAKTFENPDGEFRKLGNATFESSTVRSIGMFCAFFLPMLTKFINFKAFGGSSSKFIRSSIQHVMQERKIKGIKRNDLIDTFIELRETEPDLSMDMLIAQAAVFIAAGYETSSTTQSFALYEIARNPKIQDRLRLEIAEMFSTTDGDLTYDAVMNRTPYLHQVMLETLRMYPVIAFLDRECINVDGYSLSPFSDFKIPYKMPVYIPKYAIHLNENHFPDPLKFDPDRFSPENKSKIEPFSHLAFGGGNRDCIGKRFGMLQVKTAIIKILKEFRLEETASTPKKIEMRKEAFMILSDKPLNVGFVSDPLSI